VQLYPTEAKLIEALGSALDWCTFYESAEKRFVVDRLPGARAMSSAGHAHARVIHAAHTPLTRHVRAAERAFRVRVRAKNARGVSAWSAEQLVSTKQLPTRCGGTVRCRSCLALATRAR
jgi:hypothetical protein